jgi:hypothetical protein
VLHGKRVPPILPYIDLDLPGPVTLPVVYIVVLAIFQCILALELKMTDRITVIVVDIDLAANEFRPRTGVDPYLDAVRHNPTGMKIAPFCYNVTI